jgi:signal transduction histidine kinase
MEQVKQNPGVRFPWKHRKLHSNGHYIWIEVTIINMLHDESVRAIFTNYRDITERKKAEEALLEKNEQLRYLSAHLHNVREQERADIAREIHDELGQQLTGLKMEASWIYKKLHPRDGSLLEKISGIMHQIDNTINAVRRISTDLRPPILDDFGLAEAIKWQASEFEQHTDIICNVRSTLHGDVTDQHIALTLFRVFQESLTNVLRHSKATEVHALISDSEGQLSLIITDNGIGIDEDFIKHEKTLGILGMTERIAMVNGRFSIAKNGERGTVIQVTVPYQMKPAINQKAYD